MSNKDLRFHSWVKDSDQSDTGKLGIRIRCLRHPYEYQTILPQELKTYGVPDFQYTSAEELTSPQRER